MKKIEVKIVPALIIILCCVALLVTVPLIISSFSNYNPANYVELGQYENMTSSLSTKVSQSEIDDALIGVLRDYGANADEGYKAQVGDVVIVDYVGHIADDDNTAVPDTQGTDYDLVLGKDTFKQFDDNLFNCQKDDVVKFSVTYDKDYGDVTFAGKTVNFEVTVKDIRIIPELTDEIAFMLDKNTPTKEAYLKKVEDDIYSQKLKEVKNDIWGQVCDNATVKEYPEKQLNAQIDILMQEYIDIATENGYEDVYEYIKVNLQSEKSEFDEYIKIKSQGYLKHTMVLDAISEEEEITLTEDEYKQGVTKYVDLLSEDGYTSETVEDAFEGNDGLYQQLLWEKVTDFILETSSWDK